ncbi:hypothetical protein QP423_06490 [Lactobacillus jensenii]|jgi:hypothetical protein|uniref:Tail assembly chaperone protein n=1 Tax=Myoviridae sp. ctk251 TaxID=2826689 RepID=A0A8S5MT83_9CAUD|nr:MULTISPECIES: hypothetical protein [Lactobacillus]DAD85279.1 MAG TPA: tail assembly chaperone protein [Myoviridae sp. ctk251]DAM38207.1 MAG TPA: tail assembly chaperone protein [Caudoviricetes sp.]EEX27725.1 hypothetical protein HMPREF0527_00777 [Lactobacillus jensenii SJ-7A-US]MCF1778427.1 hypothetical protein [Lactobacillus jensenii]MCF1797560.1 hypothetical protein [Lactobacillus mulieris]
MPLVEYQLRMEAYQLQEVKRLEAIHLQAFLNQSVQATTGSAKHPKPKFNRFEKFFDVQKAIDDVRSSFEVDYQRTTTPAQEAQQIFAKRMREFKKLKAEGRIIPMSERKGG